MKTEMYSEATLIYEKLAEEHKDDFEAEFQLAVCLIQLTEFDRARGILSACKKEL